MVVSPNTPVKGGDCLDISIEPGSELVTEVWVSFLWVPSVKDIEAKSYLIEELEKLLTEGATNAGNN